MLDVLTERSHSCFYAVDTKCPIGKFSWLSFTPDTDCLEPMCVDQYNPPGAYCARCPKVSWLFLCARYNSNCPIGEFSWSL